VPHQPLIRVSQAKEFAPKESAMSINSIDHVLVVGAGTMGRQISWQCASHGFNVSLTDVDPAALEQASETLVRFANEAARSGRFTPDETEKALRRVLIALDPDTSKIDLVSESVYEDPYLKGQVFAQLHSTCPPHTIFTTNSSTLLPSMFAAATGRPDRFAALHFHLPVWSSNVADVMGHPGTSTETLEIVAAFARRIGQVPIVLKKENAGYVFNTMFNALNTAAINLVTSGVVSIEEVDRAWMGIMKMPVGPGGWLDNIGLDTVWRITDFWANAIADEQLKQNASFLKQYIEAGRLGVKSGQGFYQYPDPAFQQPGFLNGSD
jgi:3-hydroxybutyryl-CoA dehydrogenase